MVWHANEEVKQPSTQYQLDQNPSEIHALFMIVSRSPQEKNHVNMEENNKEKKATEVLQLYTLQIV
ncbi:MAG: hypothetical protein ACTSWW_13385 [Promethearchaeota archaeon]